MDPARPRPSAESATPSAKASDRPLLEAPSVVIATTAAAALLAIWYILWLYLPSFNTTDTPLTGVAHAPSTLAPTPGVARRIVVMIVDGVSYEVARSLDELMPLRRAGVMRPLAVEFPSYTDPAITSFVTGLDPSDSGMRLNGKVTGAPGLDAVTLAAADAGVPVKIRSRGWDDLADLLRARGADVSNSQVRFQAELTAATLRGWPPIKLPEGPSPAGELVINYLVEADKAAHIHGARAQEFTDNAHLAASIVARYAKTLDLDQDVLVVVSDHGHLPQGGHGGAEPEIRQAFFLAAGSFIRRGVELPERPLRDVASTLSVLAGVRVPSSNLGRPMLDVMTLDDEQRSFVLAAPFDQASRLLCSLAPSPRCAQIDALTSRLTKPDPTAWPEAEALLDAMTLDRRRAIAQIAERRANVRLGIAAAITAALLALLALRSRPAALSAIKLLPLPALHALLFCAGLYLLDYTPSFSSLKTQLLFYEDATYASLAAVAVTFIAARLVRAGPLAPWITLLGTLLPLAFLAAWVGCEPSIVPPPVTGVLILLLSPLVVSAGALASLLAAFPPKRELAARAPKAAEDAPEPNAEAA